MLEQFAHCPLILSDNNMQVILEDLCKPELYKNSNLKISGNLQNFGLKIIVEILEVTGTSSGRAR